jgi:hypothetical protein
LIRSQIGSLPILAGRGTAALGVQHYRGLCRLNCTNLLHPLKLHTFKAIYQFPTIFLGSFCVPKLIFD